MSKTYNVRAVHWAHGWELHIDGVGVTQSHGLKDAKNMIRDYIALDLGEDAVKDATISITFDLPGGLAERARAVRHETVAAAKAQERAARHSRKVVRELKQAGLPQTDIAEMLGVSRGRVSQLVRETV